MDTPRLPEAAEDDLDLTLDELAQRVSTSPRTIRYYIAQGLLPGPGARGKSASYGAEHLVRLRLIRLLSARHLPLAEIQALLRGLSLNDARGLLAAEEERSSHLRAAEGRQSPRDYISALLDDARLARPQPTRPTHPADAHLPKGPRRRLDVDVFSLGVPATSPPPPPSPHVSPQAEDWSRWVLAPGVELHVRADARGPWRALIQRLLRVAGIQAQEGDVDNEDDVNHTGAR